MGAWLSSRDGDPRWSLCWQGARLTATSIGGELCGNAHDLESEQWRHALTGDAFALADRLIAEKNDGARSLRTFVAKWRLFDALVKYALPLWCTGYGGERNPLTSWSALGEVV